MIRPAALDTRGPLPWSPGTGDDVWAMLQACAAGDLDAVRALLARDPSLARCHHAYRTPLYFGVRENRLAVARLLLERGADPFALAVDDSLLEVARDRGHADMERLLERECADRFGASAAGEPAAAAIRARDLAALRRLLDASPGLAHAGDHCGNRTIHWAAMTRQPDHADELLARGADVDAVRHDGARPIQLTNGDYAFRGWRDIPADWPVTPAAMLAHLRARGAHVDVCTAAHVGDLARVTELLDADPSLADRPAPYVTYYAGSGTPLRNAAGAGHLEIVRLLLARGADPNRREEGIAPRGHALYAAVQGGHHEIARLLLAHGADPNAPVESSADALSIALSRGDDAMVEALCAHGAARSLELLAYHGDLRTAAAVLAADPRLADDPEALECAAGNEPFLRLLLRHAPGLPRRRAVRAGTRALNELLFRHGMDPSGRDWLGGTPLHRAARAGDLEGAAIFLDHGADLRARDDHLRATPLGWAARFGQAEMARLLLDRGAPRELPDDPPWATPLAWAARRGHDEVARVLRAYPPSSETTSSIPGHPSRP